MLSTSLLQTCKCGCPLKRASLFNGRGTVKHQFGVKYVPKKHFWPFL